MHATREAALERMRRFVPAMGRRYAEGRNHDHGPNNRSNVSNLSPYIRRRLVLESEVTEAALDAHGPRAAEKFVQEVVWRTYFKGWLEQRPDVWTAYHGELEREEAHRAKYRDLNGRVSAAEAGETGIEPFDHWARELLEHGTLHNHARMWFASIWIFTLELPWALGARFFARHLVDGDPASNTLSWRWVAGLHTRGKAYAATKSNIERYTGGRFSLPDGVLAPSVKALSEPEDWPRRPLPHVEGPRMDVPSVLIATEDDCLPETLALPPIERAFLVPTVFRRDADERVRRFEHEALEDTRRRLGERGIEAEVVEANALAAAVQATGCEQVTGAYLPVGWARDAVGPVLDELSGEVAWRPVTRRWDVLFWPHAMAGYFKVKKAIPAVLSKLAT